MLQVFGYFVVHMALGETCFVADVVGIEPADDQLFKFRDRSDRPVGAEGGEVGTGGKKNKTDRWKGNDFDNFMHQDGPPENTEYS
jgi:hypothetical protein